jgi:hypothetical protein
MKVALAAVNYWLINWWEPEGVDGGGDYRLAWARLAALLELHGRK